MEIPQFIANIGDVLFSKKDSTLVAYIVEDISFSVKDYKPLYELYNSDGEEIVSEDALAVNYSTDPSKILQKIIDDLKNGK